MTHIRRRHAASLVALLALVMAAFAPALVPAAAHADDHGTERDAPAADGGTIAWTGNGSDNLPCPDGIHWVFTAGSVDSAQLTFNGTTYQPTKHVGAVHFSTPGASSAADIDASVSYTGDTGSGNAVLTISNCEGTGDDEGDDNGDDKGDDPGDDEKPAPLRLTFMQECPEDVEERDGKVRWRVSNPNDVEVTFTYEVVGTAITGEGTVAAASTTEFFTAFGKQTVRLKVDGEQVDVKAGGDTYRDDCDVTGDEPGDDNGDQPGDDDGDQPGDDDGDEGPEAGVDLEVSVVCPEGAAGFVVTAQGRHLDTTAAQLHVAHSGAAAPFWSTDVELGEAVPFAWPRADDLDLPTFVVWVTVDDVRSNLVTLDVDEVLALCDEVLDEVVDEDDDTNRPGTDAPDEREPETALPVVVDRRPTPTVAVPTRTAAGQLPRTGLPLGGLLAAGLFGLLTGAGLLYRRS